MDEPRGFLPGFGPFRLLRRLAIGGTSEVFEATAGHYPRPVVVKRLMPHAAEVASVREGFLREVSLGALLARHRQEAFVPVLESGDVRGWPYLVLELVDGLDLLALDRRLVEQDERLGDDELAAIALGLGEALACLGALGEPSPGTARGLVHGDISPRNVMIATSGAVRLLDLGSATWSGSPGPPAGTPSEGKRPFVAPERLAGAPLDARTDLFAVATLLRRLPRHGETSRVRSVLAPILARCAEPDPGARPRGPRCLINAARELLGASDARELLAERLRRALPPRHADPLASRSA